jgi:alpha-tubulin suppressor-like RCC1 family protein
MSNRWKGGFVQYFFDPLTAGPANEFGPMYSWGGNANGQLGQNTQGTASRRSSPVQVGSDSVWLEVSSGYQQAMAVTVGGELYGWGSNDSGQLGLNDRVNRSSPTQVGALTTWSKVDCGRKHALAIKTDGTLWAWGLNGQGGVGDNTNTNRSSPVQVGSLTTWTKISAGMDASFAINTSEQLFAWGYSSSHYQTGLDVTTSISSPTQISSPANWLDVCAGYYGANGISSDNKLYSWGRSSNGESGLNNRTTLTTPNVVGALTNWSELGTLFDGRAAVKTDGTLWRWGVNDQGQLMLNDKVTRSSPAQVGSLTDWEFPVKALYGDDQFFCVKTDGTLWVAGSNDKGALGLSLPATTYRSSPVQIGSETTWRKVALTRASSVIALEES